MCSGGPLYLVENGTFLQIGVTSFGSAFGCEVDMSAGESEGRERWRPSLSQASLGRRVTSTGYRAARASSSGCERESRGQALSPL